MKIADAFKCLKSYLRRKNEARVECHKRETRILLINMSCPNETKLRSAFPY